ncbi:MAG: hypothetical protein UY62_C0030G0006 [Parcubacteria group bacterium GW2011_GWF2_50_9]|nr:MAG: hypothetical protein UY62_C0030G0006 [Parcubacteria group bacterium GW2011_GWF2_50_9]
MTEKRLALECKAMHERWGKEPKLRRRSNGEFFWKMTLKTEGNDFPIEIGYPISYPAAPPYLIAKFIIQPGTGHVIHGNPCWINPGTTRAKNQWMPAYDTAALVVGVAYRWVQCYSVWLAIKKWPMEEAI